MHMKEATTGRLYDAWAWIYDGTFGKLVERRQKRAVAELRAGPGQRVLDLGVGTGMTLNLYPPEVKVIGVDLSAGMLRKAEKKIQQQQLTNCQLVQADALLAPFEDESFDHIMITHVISVVSDPVKLLHEARRLVKPNGRIVILNHFQSSVPFVAFWERLFNPIFIKIGWKSDLSLEDCLAGVNLHAHYRFKLRTLDIWQIVVLSPQQPNDATETQPVAHDARQLPVPQVG